MKNFKIILAILLCLAFLLPLFTACGKDSGNTDTNNTTIADDDSGGETTTTPEEEKDPDAPNLSSVDMGGKVFTFLTQGWGSERGLSNDIVGEEQTGDPINDAAFNRRVKIEQAYNCTLKIVNVASADDAVSSYRTSILAADGAYDVAITACTNFKSLLTGSYLTDFEELTYVDMDKPYWNKNFYETMSIMGKHYAADGDISKRRLECVWIMAFNKDIISKNEFDSPYDLVKSGEWTYFKMHEMARAAASDLNGDGTMDFDNDLWGLNYTGDTIMGIINSSGVRIAEINSDGVPELVIGNAGYLEKLARIYEDMRNNDYSVDTLFSSLAGGVGKYGDVDIFSENRCLFLACASHNVAADTSEGASNTRSLRSMDVNLGIIPYPKWDASTPDYTPFTAGNYHPVLTVPKTNGDLDNTSIILEAMAYEGMKNISPAFYENLLKTKTARDDESEAMIDFIFGNLNYDIGVMFDFGGILGEFGYNASVNTRMNVVSTIERSVGKWQKAIDKIVEEIEKGD